EIQVMGKEIAEDSRRTGLEHALERFGLQRVLGLRSWNLESRQLTHGKKFDGERLLLQRVDEPCEDDLHLVHLASQKEVARETGDRPRIGKRRTVTVGELGGELPAGAGDELSGPAPCRHEH